MVLQTQDQILLLLQSVEQKLEGLNILWSTATSNIFSSSSLTSAVYKHYLFDIVLFTHLNIKTAQSFTTGEVVTGSTSGGATGVVQSVSTTESETITGATKANPVVITSGHKLKEGQQITITGVSGMTELNNNVYTVRNPSTNKFSIIRHRRHNFN